MIWLMARFETLLQDTEAVTALEYGLIAAVVAAVMVVGAATLGTNLSSLFTAIAGTV